MSATQSRQVDKTTSVVWGDGYIFEVIHIGKNKFRLVEHCTNDNTTIEMETFNFRKHAINRAGNEIVIRRFINA